MTSPHDPIVTSARIVTPEDASLDRSEQALAKIMLGLARTSGVPVHFVQFADGVAALVVGDPDDTESWRKALAQVHEAATNGLIGPISTEEK